VRSTIRGRQLAAAVARIATLAALVGIAATAGCSRHHTDQSAAWTSYEPRANAAAFADLVKSLRFEQVSNTTIVDPAQRPVQAAISPEAYVNLLEPDSVTSLRPKGAKGRVLAKITYTDPRYDLPYFGFVHTDHSKVVYWWLSMPSDDQSSWWDDFVSVNANGQVDSVVYRPFTWMKDNVPYPQQLAADWVDSHHARPDTSRKGGPGWTSCGSGCCN
jgi:hypothetical protein